MSKKKSGLDIPSLEAAIEACRSKNDRLRGAPNARPFKDYRVHYVSSARDNEETSLKMLVAKAYDLIEERTNECTEKFADPKRALSDLYVLCTRTTHLYTWGKDDRWKVNQGAKELWLRELDYLQRFSEQVPVLVCGPGRSLERAGGEEGIQMQKEAEHRMNDIRCRNVPVVSADAVSWGAELDKYGRAKQLGRGNVVMPAFLAALPDYYSMTRTEWPLEVTSDIREAMIAELERRSSSKIGRSRSVSESEDADMGGGSAGQPPVGEYPARSSGSGTRRENLAEEEPRLPPRTLLTGEEMGARRPKSPAMPPRSTTGTRSRSPPPVAAPANAGLPAVPEATVTNRWTSAGRAAEEREQPEVEDLLTSGPDPPLDEFAEEEPSEAVENPADTDVPMEAGEEPSVTTDEEKVPTVRETSPSVPETPRESDRGDAPGREEQQVNIPEGRGEAEPETAVSTPRARRPEVPKYADDDEDLRGTAKAKQEVVTGVQEGGVHDNVGLPYPDHPGRSPELLPPAVRHHREAQSYAMTRGSRTLAKPAETPSHRLFIVNHILAREAGEPFIYAVIRNKAITKARVSQEEWEAAQKTSHIVIPTRVSEQQEILERAVHNDFMYGAIDAARVTARVDMDYVDPRDRVTRPWADQVWDMRKRAREASDIPVGMRNDIQAKHHHGRAQAGDWADMPDRDDYMVRGVVSDPNRQAYDCLRAPGVRATLLNAQTGQCIPLDDPTWVPEVAGSHLLAATITTISSHVDCALGRAWRMPMFHPQLMGATAMLEKLQKYFAALNEAVLGKRLGTAPFSHIAGHLAPELKTVPMSDTLAQSAEEILLSHVSALSHSGSREDRAQILGQDGQPFGKSWFEDDPEGATWPGHHMAGGVAYPLKPKTKIRWGKRPEPQPGGDDDHDEQHPEAASSGHQETRKSPGRGDESEKGKEDKLPDIGKLSMAEKKDAMEVDEEGHQRAQSGLLKSQFNQPPVEEKNPDPQVTGGKGQPVPEEQKEWKEHRRTGDAYRLFSGDGDDKRILPKNTPIEMDKPLPADVAMLIPRAVATQEEAEEAERAAMAAIRGVARLPDVGQDDRAAVKPEDATPEYLDKTIDDLTRKLSNMPEWSGNLLDPRRSAELVAARWGGRARYDKPEPPVTEAGMRSATQEERAYALSELEVVVEFHKKHLCSAKGDVGVGALAPDRAFAPAQLRESRLFLPMNGKPVYNSVLQDGRVDYIGERQILEDRMRGDVPNEIKFCRAVVPAKTTMMEYIPGYDPNVAPSPAAKQAAKLLMKSMAVDFDGVTLNSQKVSEVFDPVKLKTDGRRLGNWLSADQAIWFLKEVGGIENAIRTWNYFIPIIKAFPVGQVDVLLMVMYTEADEMVKEHTRLVAVRQTRIGRDLNYQDARKMYVDQNAIGGPLVWELAWQEVPPVGYIMMKFPDFRKAVQIQRIKRNGRAMIELLIVRPDEYHNIGDGREDEGLVQITAPIRPDANVSPSWYIKDRMRNYAGRYVVVMVDLRVYWSKVAAVYLTRRKTLAVREEIQVGAWKAAYFHDEYTMLYHRTWDYADFAPGRGVHQRSNRDRIDLCVSTTLCLRRAEIVPCGMHLCTGCALPIFYPGFVPTPEGAGIRDSPLVPDWVKEMGQFAPRSMANDEVGVIKRTMISFSMSSDLRLTVQSGIRLPSYINPEEGGVRGAWDKMQEVLFRSHFIVGVRESDLFVEKAVAKSSFVLTL